MNDELCNGEKTRASVNFVSLPPFSPPDFTVLITVLSNLFFIAISSSSCPSLTSPCDTFLQITSYAFSLISFHPSSRSLASVFFCDPNLSRRSMCCRRRCDHQCVRGRRQVMTSTLPVSSAHSSLGITQLSTPESTLIYGRKKEIEDAHGRRGIWGREGGEGRGGGRRWREEEAVM